MNIWLTSAALLAAYLLGAVPFGLLIGKARGVDIRSAGSGNIGATNTGRILGKKLGYVCLLLDILKGLVPAVLATFVLFRDAATPREFGWVAAFTVAPVIGHIFPVFLGFRGGKGVATTIGAALGVFPQLAIAIVVALLGYLVVKKGTGFVSLGSLTIAALFPVAAVVVLLLQAKPGLQTTWPLALAAVVMSLLIVVRHRENIARLRSKSELAN